MVTVIVLGGSGLLGKAMIKELNQYQDFRTYGTHLANPTGLTPERSLRLDIGDLAGLRAILTTLWPDLVISALRGDFGQQLVFHGEIADYLKENGGRLYFFSTANVFDNDLTKPHDEDDLPNSRSEYGQFKITCERRLVELLGDKACILRLPQVWGKHSQRLDSLRKSLKNNEKIAVYPNLFISAISDQFAAEKAVYIIRHNLKGIFHLAAEDIVNHRDFYTQLIAGLGYNQPVLEENPDESGYFALVSKRNNEFPSKTFSQ